ncbi:MAG: hypothetical protein IT458_10415 [Planctomycetes bacterium]|nr:hypothetical protein [Planctomycetota bacterium]
MLRTGFAATVLLAGYTPAQGDLTGGAVGAGGGGVVHTLPPPVSVTNPAPPPSRDRPDFASDILATAAGPAPTAAGAPAWVAALQAGVQPARIRPGSVGSLCVVLALREPAILESSSRLAVELAETSGALTFGHWQLVPRGSPSALNGYRGRPVHEDTATILVPLRAGAHVADGVRRITIRVRADLNDGATASSLGAWEGQTAVDVYVAALQEPRAAPEAELAIPGAATTTPPVEPPEPSAPALMEPSHGGEDRGLLLAAAGLAAAMLLLLLHRRRG